MTFQKKKKKCNRRSLLISQKIQKNTKKYKKIQKNTKEILIYYLHKLKRHSKMFNKDSKCL